MSISEQIELLRSSCDECIDNGQSIAVPKAISPGDMLPQGDIGLLMIQGSEPPSSTWRRFAWPDGDMQLAPGNTKGSRHMIPKEFSGVVELYRIDDGDQLSDLGLVASKPFDLLHPEHADHIGYPPGVYRVRHQQNAQRQRVLD